MHEILGSWERLGHGPLEALRKARLQLHWAAQIPGAAGRALAAPEADDGHTSLAWRGGLLVSRALEDGRRLGLDLAGLALVLLAPDDSPVERRPLAGTTLDAAFDWADTHLGTAALRRPDYDMPEHPVAGGAAFVHDDPVPFQELARWYGNAALALERLREDDPRSSAVRCWPHHFDIATLLSLDPPGGDPETARSVGFGLSPGDDTFPDPYWYVLPWPPPEGVDLPPLDGGGSWCTDPFTACVLHAADLLRTEDPERQAGRTLAFLRSSRGACLRLLRD